MSTTTDILLKILQNQSQEITQKQMDDKLSHIEVEAFSCKQGNHSKSITVRGDMNTNEYHFIVYYNGEQKGIWPSFQEDLAISFYNSIII